MSDETPDADRTPDEIRDWLTDINDMAALLPDAAITRTKPNGGGRSVPSSRPPVNLAVLHLLGDDDKPDPTLTTGMGWAHGMQHVDPDRIGVLPYLDGWVRDICATLWDEHPEVPDEVPETPTVTNCCDWLNRHADAAATLAQWPELVYGLRRMRKAMRAATGGVRDRVEKPVPCQLCGQPLHRVGMQALWECDSGHQTSVQAVTLSDAHARLRKEAEGAWVPSMSTLKGWSRRQGLMPCLRESERVSYYDLGTIRKLVVEARLRGA